jgi:hypothetical protein
VLRCLSAFALNIQKVVVKKSFNEYAFSNFEEYVAETQPKKHVQASRSNRTG